MLANVLCALITFLFITDIAHIENVRQCGWQGAVRGGQGEGVMAALVIRLGVVVGVAVAGVGTADTAWAKLVGAGFFKVGATLFLMSEVEEFSRLRPPLRGF